MAGGTIPNYLVGRNCTAFIGSDLYINNAGQIVTGTPVDFHALGILDQWEYEISTGAVEISSLDAYWENELPTKGTHTITVAELQQPSGASKLLNVSFTQSTLMGFEAYIQDPNTGAGTLVTMIGRIRSIRGGLVTGKNATVATLGPASIAPYYSTAVGGANASPTAGILSGNILRGNVRQ